MYHNIYNADRQRNDQTGKQAYNNKNKTALEWTVAELEPLIMN